jgi:hypothetical protein
LCCQARRAVAPTFTLEGAGEWLAAREPGRTGRLGLLAISARQRLATDWVARIRHEHSRNDARATAFDRTARESTVAIEWEVASGWRLSAAAAYRQGDVLAYATPPRPDILRVGRAAGLVTTFDRERPMMSYVIYARTVSWRLESAHSLGADQTLAVAAEYRDTTRGAVTYLNRNLSLGLGRRF